MYSHLRAEMAPQPLVPALGQQVKVELPERGPVPVRIIGRRHDTVWIGRLQPVVRDRPDPPAPRRTPQRRCTRLISIRWLTGEDDHADRVGPPPADHHTVAALTVLCRVSAQQMVRIMVLAELTRRSSRSAPSTTWPE